ncbi:H-NS family nucleoid-associated regulatory protein [Roseomonas sp. CCTCC AB2023176]|uniref:H-NS histone family protein n=1 Tax=Roseomonas sp. CCTCC AB2023176 TaxID=3342640 RepID=UPI0035D70567
MATKSRIDQMDLDQLSAEELTQLIRTAEEKRREKQEEAKASLLDEMRRRAEALGLSLDQLVGGGEARAPARRTRRDAGKPAGVKFRGPGGEEWSGRGRPPTWLTKLEATGKKRDEFRI